MSTVWLAADERGRTAVLAIGHRVLAGQADRGAFLACAATPSRVAASKPGTARRRIPWLRAITPP
jgi:hypothetical protein